MTQISTKRKNPLIISAVIITLVISCTGVILILQSNSINQKDNVIVSGTVVSTGVFTMFPTSLQTLEFTDTQTGTKTTYNFHYPPQSINTAGNYSVTLKNGHTYSVTLTYYLASLPPAVPPTHSGRTPYTENFGTFTVHTPEGKTSVSKNFPFK
jgi:hypothetical protein